MAASKNTPAPSNSTNLPPVPAGFTQVQSADRRYWIHEHDGRSNPLQGYPIARYERHDSTEEKRGYFYTFKLTAPCLAVDRDKAVHEQKAGEVVIVDERVQLAGIADFLEMPNVVELYVVSKGKIKGGKGTVVLFDIHARPTNEPRPQLPRGAAIKALPAHDESPSADDGVIPFG
jgi:hypothetical protein